MMAELNSASLVRFGAFEINLQTRELRKHGVRVRLQGKPFALLSALLQRPGHLVTREELQTRLWSSDTFVDFESGLNSAVNRLRIALGDSAERPIYVETLARLGYRFIAPVSTGFPESAVHVSNGKVAQATSESVERPEPPAAKFTRRRGLATILALAAVLLAAIAISSLGLLGPEVSFQKLTFREGFVSNARFTGNGDAVVYSAAWNGGPSRLFLANTAPPESRDLDVSDALLTGLSPTSEIGFFTILKDSPRKVLESVPIGGGIPQRISDHARQMDWGPTGILCLVTVDKSTYTVEYPVGRKVYISPNLLTDLRVSPDGREIAFAEHPIPEDDAGRVVAVNLRSGEARVLSAGWASLDGLAWNPSGREVWFTGAQSGVERRLMAAGLDGAVRLVAQIPGGMQLRDISRSGKVLIDRGTLAMKMQTGSLVDNSVRDISWLDWSKAAGITADGKTVLFDESGSGGGKAYSVFLQKAGSATPQRIGEGRALDLSSDGRFALTQGAADASKLTLISLEQASTKSIEEPGFIYHWAKFFPDNCEILFTAYYPGRGLGLYRKEVPDGRATLVSASAHLESAVISPAGDVAVGMNDNYETVTVNLRNGQTHLIALQRPATPVVFAADDTVLTERNDGKAIVFDFLNWKTGQSTFYKRLETADFSGLDKPFCFYVAKDLKTFVYSRHHNISNLFVVSGWR